MLNLEVRPRFGDYSTPVQDLWLAGVMLGFFPLFDPKTMGQKRGRVDFPRLLCVGGLAGAVILEIYPLFRRVGGRNLEEIQLKPG